MFGVIKPFRRDKKKHQVGVSIQSYITQHNTTNLHENSVVNGIKPLLEKKLFKYTQTKQYYIVFEDSRTTIISDTNDMESNSQKQITSYGEIPKLGETSTQNAKEHEW